MIHFIPATKTFNLILASSVYAFQVDGEGRLVHLAWAPRPAGAADNDVIDGHNGFETANSVASFERQTQRDEFLTFGDITYHEVSLKASFASLPGVPAAHEALHLPIRDVRLRYAGHEVVTDAQPGLAPTHGQPTSDSAPRETLRVLLRDPAQPFAVTLCYRLTPEHDILERWCELENSGQGAVTIEALSFGVLHLPRGATELTSVSGIWAREFTTQRERLPVGIRVIEQRGLQTGHFTNPFFLANRPGQAWEESGLVYFGALAFSGSWRITAEHLPSGDVRIHGGYNPFDFRLELAPGQRHVTPAWVCGVVGDGWGGASRRLHAFTRRRVLPRAPGWAEERPVLYNSWEATYFDLSFDGQTELARKAAAIGVEMFCVDDGWFGARRNDLAGLGDWVVSPEVFPDGLDPLIDVVHGLGMRFGIWVEPEMINPDSDLYRQHPDWALHFPGRPRSEARSQLILDFGRPEVVAHIYDALDRLLSQHAIDFFKWDMNRNVSEPGSAAGQAIWYRHAEAVYGIMDRLRRAHPHLSIESCSGGGARIDLGILARTDQFWTSDNTDAFDRIRIQEGCSLVYPAMAMEAWVTDVPNHQTGRISPLSLRFDVAMRGALGIGANLNRLSQAELKECASFIAFYKGIRQVVQQGDLYRLERLEENGASVVQYVLPDRREAVYSVTIREHQIDQHRPPAVLRGLHPSAIYSAVDRHGQDVYRASGFELMTQGILNDAGKGFGYSRTLHLRQV
jgi:alpha-galactosidase